MTVRQAMQILGVEASDTDIQIKKKYRRLIVLVHPDAQEGEHLKTHGICYSAQEINDAYTLLMKKENKRIRDDAVKEKSGKAKTSGATSAKYGSGKAAETTEKGCGRTKSDRSKWHERGRWWSAPLNRDAYMEREIYQYAEGTEGEIIGSFCVAKGKYYWDPHNEDFQLFIKSLLQCCRSLQEQVLIEDATVEWKKELLYLLAQQYTQPVLILEQLAKEILPGKEEERIFQLSAMLEYLPGYRSQRYQSQGNRKNVVRGKINEKETREIIYIPGGFRDHRLYQKDDRGVMAGYLSFPDDRLYYAVIPLMEQKKVQVKIRRADEEKRYSSRFGYENLKIWIRLQKNTEVHSQADISDKIKDLLRSYGRR